LSSLNYTAVAAAADTTTTTSNSTTNRFIERDQSPNTRIGALGLMPIVPKRYATLADGRRLCLDGSKAKRSAPKTARI